MTYSYACRLAIEDGLWNRGDLDTEYYGSFFLT